jgi:hypothetical protein
MGRSFRSSPSSSWGCRANLLPVAAFDGLPSYAHSSGASFPGGRGWFPDLVGQFFPGNLPVLQRLSREIEASVHAQRAPVSAHGVAAGVTRIRVERSEQWGGQGEVLGALRLIGIGVWPIPFDTTPDTTQSAPPRNSRQPRAKKSAYLSRFCNSGQPLETDVGGLWLRRSRVRVQSVTLCFAG